MAGTIVSDTIQDGAGASTTTTNVINGCAKAWVNFNGSTATRNAYYNVSSITRNSTGNYTVNFTNAFADANYCISVRAFTTTNGAWGIGGAGSAFTTTSCTFYCQDYDTTYTDYPYVSVACFR